MKLRCGTRNLTRKACITIMCAFFVLGMTGVACAADSDSDGMSDEYELFYGLNPRDPRDARQDNDKDTLKNIEEAARMTDPFAPDTDRDGWNDGPPELDQAPISRAFIKWGDPKFSHGDVYSYAAPEWLLNAYKIDGDWLTNPICWHVPATESNDVGSLNVDLNREILTTNNVRYRVKFFDTTSGMMFMDLLTTNGITLVTNLFGNIQYGSNTEVTVCLDVPLATYTNAAVIHLRRGSGETRVYESLIYIDCDGDGLDADAERQLGTSDYNADSDGDGLSDYAEVFMYRTDPTKADTDKDGMPDGWEVKHGLNPLKNDAHGDKDKDGVDNLTEYLQGRDPQAGATNDTTSVVNLKVYTVME